MPNTPIIDEPTPSGRSWLQSAWQGLVDWFDQFLDLREGMDREGAIASIKQGKFMRGTNAWMLVCSIMIASLGLNLDSQAVIIGAMLISPLMNPILGLGLGVATNDRETLGLAIRHFLIAIAIALVTSTLYFLLTPLKEYTPEIDARTKPTILDGMVAIFGGLAGIISVTRADKTNAIPGVAIATALMPPLCVCGYGLASGEWDIALRSFYLFFLNSFFIATTAYIIIRLLRFPYRTYVNKREARRSRLLIAVFSILIIIPGFFILRDVVRDERVRQGANRFVRDHFKSSCTEYQLFPVGEDSSLLVMELLNREIPADSIIYYNELIRERPYRLEHTTLIAVPDNNVSLKQIAELRGRQETSLNQMEAKLDALQQAQDEAYATTTAMENELHHYRMDSSVFFQFNAMVRAAFPTVTEVNVALAQSSVDTTFVDQLPLVVVHREAGGSRLQRREELDRLQKYLQEALKVDTLKLVEY
ncbi:MAG: TIGR00341 family protein [Bacteroidota bacterium]